ncbi:MAG TPA: nuclear transport factor 2 family protein [Candidatus Dormibacteraeota bacterium]|nr:nuclear transport factor 2 family protein [Candidatus Dormibacteraeota bacterium]
MSCSRRVALVALCCLLCACCLAQSDEEIPIERCDVLPVISAKIAGKGMRFLLDTAATSILNVKSFSSGVSKEIHVSSWSGMAATSAREVSIPEMLLGNHSLKNLKLPAIDLSPIGKACGGQIDGILGVDLLDQMGVTIDLKRRVATLKGIDANPRDEFNDMEKSMERCTDAFNLGHADELVDCLDTEIVFYTPSGEYRGRKQVMEYLQNTYLKFAPNLHYNRQIHDIRSLGDALWYSYDYTLEMPGHAIAGHGTAMCRKQDGRWRMLNMHNSMKQADGEPTP